MELIFFSRRKTYVNFVTFVCNCLCLINRNQLAQYLEHTRTSFNILKMREKRKYIC